MKCTILIKPKIKDIKITRSLGGFSTVDLAEKSGLHYTTIQAIESGRNRAVSPKTAKKISDALNKELETLFEVYEKGGCDNESR